MKMTMKLKNTPKFNGRPPQRKVGLHERNRIEHFF